MKKFLKKLILVFSFMICVNLQPCFSNEDKKETFNFIKTEEKNQNFIYNDSILLYGGVFLISVSIVGIVFIFLNSKKK